MTLYLVLTTKYKTIKQRKTLPVNCIKIYQNVIQYFTDLFSLINCMINK